MQSQIEGAGYSVATKVAPALARTRQQASFQLLPLLHWVGRWEECGTAGAKVVPDPARPAKAFETGSLAPLQAVVTYRRQRSRLQSPRLAISYHIRAPPVA